MRAALRFNTAFTSVGRGGVGVVLERYIELHMDAEGEIAGNKSGARRDPCSEGIFLDVLQVVRREYSW